MFRILKYLFFLSFLGFIALIAYAYLAPFFGADFAPAPTEIRTPVVLDAN
ncbi:hypothetical protein [Litorivita pollutaquae]|nr:hypothetical protein [Litorivita pollutaquae]